MKERPIIFNGEMVRAILDGRKTQTRRLIKHLAVPNEDIVSFQEFLNVPKSTMRWEPKEGYYALLKCNANHDNRTIYFKCPYGRPGDRLWVREAFGFDHERIHDPYYKATEQNLDIFPKGYWHPSIHMPRSLSRITLEITREKAERVQNINEKDAIVEGMEPKEPNHVVSASYRFGQFWNSINKKRGYGWDVNPWVWVIEFKKVD